MTEATIGHNSEPKLAADQLRSIIERVENIEADIKGLSDDRSDIYKEAKGNGFDVKAIKTIVRLRKQDPEDRQEQETVLETYMHALGMI